MKRYRRVCPACGFTAKGLQWIVDQLFRNHEQFACSEEWLGYAVGGHIVEMWSVRSELYAIVRVVDAEDGKYMVVRRANLRPLTPFAAEFLEVL